MIQFTQDMLNDLSAATSREWLKNFETHLTEACLGQISEIFDGDLPHTPRGCVAQAWSVAEILRAAVEDVSMSRPAARAATISLK